jgi:putative transposase
MIESKQTILSKDMKYNPEIHHRKSIRLRGYDYSQNGLYFITICTKDRQHIFGSIANGMMQLNPQGQIAHTEWQQTAQIRPEICLHEHIIMPNHMHGIIEIANAINVRAHRMRPIDGTIDPLDSIDPNISGESIDFNEFDDLPGGQRGRMRCAPTLGDLGDLGNQWDLGQRVSTLGDILRGYKSSVTKQINQLRDTPGMAVWQRNYYEHIIRNEKAYYNISHYIKNNPQQWQRDKLSSLIAEST